MAWHRMAKFVVCVFCVRECVSVFALSFLSFEGGERNDEKRRLLVKVRSFLVQCGCASGEK